MIEARVAFARTSCRLRIGVVEVLDDGLHRGVQAVEIESVEADRRHVGGQSVVPFAQPGHELDDVGVPPHPGREPAEVRERLFREFVVVLAPHESVDAVGVGPVALDGDRGEPLLGDQPLRDLGARTVELVGSVGRLADQDEARLRRPLEQRVVVRGRSGEWPQRAGRLHLPLFPGGGGEKTGPRRCRGTWP